MKIKRNTEKDSKTLYAIGLNLEEAAKVQPCPACKQDIEQLKRFIDAKADAVKSDSKLNKEEIRALKEVDFVNELTDIAIVVSKIIKPFTMTRKVPESYEKTLNNDMEGNRKVKVYLLEAAKKIKELKLKNKHYMLISDIINSFIRVIEFKLSTDPLTFYLFDRTIRIGYKTHVLSATSKTIVTIKGIINPSRYK